MSISAVETKIPNAISVEMSGKALSVKLSDGRTVSISVDQYPRLAYATKQERANWRIIGRGHGIHWEDLDEDISVEGLLAGNRSRESKSSLKSWLMARRQPTFRPWTGEGYGKTNDFASLPANLLILGESHYDKLHNLDNDATRAVIRAYLEEGGQPFFTKIVHTVLGPDTSEKKAGFFKSIAFYNYVQRIVGDTHNARPTAEMWNEAAAPFRATLEFLRPTHILVCGMRLWDNMPESEGFWTPPSKPLIRWLDSVEFPKYSRSPYYRSLGFYCHPQGQSVVLAIYHPSWKGFQPPAWHPIVKRFLEYRAG